MQSNKSKRRFISQRFMFELIGVLLLVGLGIASRFWLVEYPNFKPVAAMALLVGALFQYRLLAFIAPVAILGVSDLFFGFYETPVMIAVYGSMILAVSIGLLLGRVLKKFDGPKARCGSVGVASVLISIQFFLLTNAATCFAGWYPVTPSGFMACYIAGLPFLKFTLFGDLAFSLTLFSAVWCVSSVWSQRGITVHSTKFERHKVCK